MSFERSLLPQYPLMQHHHQQFSQYPPPEPGQVPQGHWYPHSHLQHQIWSAPLPLPQLYPQPWRGGPHQHRHPPQHQFPYTGDNLKKDEKASIEQKLDIEFDFKASILDAQPENESQREKVEEMIKTSKAQAIADMKVATGPSKGWVKKISSGAGQVRVMLIPESNHGKEHGQNVDNLVNDIENGKFKVGAVICLERKQQGKNLGMEDVIVLANIVKHNKENPHKKITIPELPKGTAIYKDAELYNAARGKGVRVIGIEGKTLPSVKESSDYNAIREQHMVSKLLEVASAGHEVVFPVGSAHIAGLVDGLNNKGIATSIVSGEDRVHSGFVAKVRREGMTNSLER